jgi:hypothetical protein
MRIAITTIFLLLASACASLVHCAGLDFPVLTPDGQNVRADAPQWAQPIIAAPNLVAMIWWNDNFRTDPFCTPRGRGCDLDANDAVARLLFNASGTNFSLFYFASVTGDVDYLGGPGGVPWLQLGKSATYSSTPGTEVILPMLNSSTGDIYFTGDPTRNPDGSRLHAFLIVASQPGTSVPEPSTAWLLSGAFAACVLLRRCRVI